MRLFKQRQLRHHFNLDRSVSGYSLSNMFKRQWLPDAWKIYPKDEILRLIGEEDASKLRRKLTRYYTDKAISEGGRKITPQQADAIEASIKQQLDNKEELFVAIEDLKDADKIDISFYITDETKGSNLLDL